MEEEAAARLLLSEENLDENASSSSITFMLVFTTLVIVCGPFVYGCAMGYSSPAESGILDELGLSTSAYSLFGSMLTIGGLAGALFSGKIADLIGRRGAIWVSNVFSIIGWLAITLSEGAWSLDLGRLSVGIGSGITCYVAPTYTAEITPKNFRGAFISISTLMVGSGMALTFIIGSICSWRILALTGVIPCVIQFLGVFFIPESPRWLAKAGREKELEIALQRFRGKNADISFEAAEIINFTRDSSQIAEDGIKELFQGKYAYAIIVVVGLFFLAQFGGQCGYTYYLSSILESAGFPTGVGSAAASIAQIVANICSLFLIDKYGRRPLLLISSVGSCLASVITGLSFLLQDFNLGKEFTPILALTGTLTYLASLSIGLAGIPWTIMAEIFPVNVKGSAGSLANVVNSSGSAIVAYTFNYLFDWSSAGVFFIYSIISGSGIIFVAKMVPETKGRTLEEIHAWLVPIKVYLVLSFSIPVFLHDWRAMEEGAMARSLLSEENLDENGGVETSSSSSSPITFLLVFTTFIIVCGYFIYGCSIGYSSPAESGILDELGISTSAYSVFGSILTAGGLAGALFSGKIADLTGRRGAIWVSNVFCIIGWLAIILSKGAWSLDLGRLSVGIGVGIISYVTPTYIAEITPKNLRGAFASLNTLMMGCGISLMFIIGSICNWRILAVLGAIPCAIQFLGAFFIPESPRWLAKVGRENELEISLQRLRGKNADISLEAAEIIGYTQDFGQIAEDGIKELFQWKYAHAITVGVVLMLLLQFGGQSGYTFYLSSILESAGFPSGVGSAAASIAQIVMNICSLFLIDKYGRRPLLLVSSVGSCLASLVTGLSFLLQDLNLVKEITPVLALIGILVYVASISIGLGGIPWIIMAEIFPVNVKGSAGSLVTLINWSGSWIVAYTFNYLFDWSSAGVFFVYSIISGLGVMFVAKMVPETKGRTLEEIQTSLITH
ncbi:uncharacterized protein LOC105647834 [Jatropha curcas]|uniref:uncharacterized protein LOC105647834 n=1 Tax=Jatropha curcas TaxID=180498 RepID=UPI0009D6C469|nr:uncharacterized protein LOC105647834 [Jatropha curcas]